MKKHRSGVEAVLWRPAWAGDHNISRNNASQAEIFSLRPNCPPDQATRARKEQDGPPPPPKQEPHLRHLPDSTVAESRYEKDQELTLMSVLG